MKTLELKLTGKDCDNACKYLAQFAKQIEANAKELTARLVEDGAFNAELNANYPSGINFAEGAVTGSDGEYKGEYTATGESVTFDEFGTGVRYNGPAGKSPHPKGRKNGMLIGRYGLGQGANPNGWYFGHTHTYGRPASMFMYKSATQVAQDAPKIAQEVFKK